MGSKKLKRRKTKFKKLQKLCRSKTIKFCRGSSTRGFKELSLERALEQKSVSDRLSDNEKCSRSCFDKKYSSSVKYFSQIREHYFRYLQTVVSNNCAYYNSHVTKDMLENLSLKLEQHAILACLQADIYEKCIKKIISDIEKSTEDAQIHCEIKKCLPWLVEKNTSISVKTENFTKNPPTETYSQIPKIATSRANDTIQNEYEKTGEIQHSEGSDFYYSYSDQYFGNINELHNNYQNQTLQLCNNNESNTVTVNESNYWSNKADASLINRVNIHNLATSVAVSQLSDFMKQNQNVSDESVKSKPVSKVPPQTVDEVDPLFKFRKQLQKSVEESLSNLEKLNIQKKDDKERAYITQILEGGDSLDDKSYDSLSDMDESESKENVDESNLMDRLEKMRELFGVEDEDSNISTTVDKLKILKFTPNSEHPRRRRSTVWKYEKVIQLHKLSMLTLEITPEKQAMQQKLFLKLFGEDSDEENEARYRSVEKYRTSCTERISSWVVKYLMPFYHDKRIIGRNVFKSLGHYISNSIIDEIQYPDEWAVKYFVSKFFPPRKRYVCDADILNFQID